jgi:hypothetical protein
VEERSHQAFVIHVHIGEDMRYRDRMAYIGVAALPQLAAMALLGELVSANDFPDLRRT